MHTMRRFFGPAALVAALFAGNSANAAANTDPTGVWINDTGRGAVEIKPCGSALCGHVVWVKDQADSSGCGRQIIGEATSVGSGQWDNGWIYSPERKKKYNVELTPMDGDKLKVKGYAGTKLFSKTMIWTRAPADLARCSTQEAAAQPVGPANPAASESKPSSVASGTPATAKPETNKAPAAGAASPAPAPAPDTKAAAADPVQPEEDGNVEKGPDLADALGQYLKKSPDGTCKLDLPWVKVKFDCDK